MNKRNGCKKREKNQRGRRERGIKKKREREREE